MTPKAQTLSSLGLTARGAANPQITGLAVDSRQVRDGFLFAAMPGSRFHGATFVETALRQGAVAVLTDHDGARLAAEAIAAAGAALVVSDAPREALALTAALWFGGQPETMVAVTGTNGKTSVSTFVRQIWIEMGLPAVNLGTTGVEGATDITVAFYNDLLEGGAFLPLGWKGYEKSSADASSWTFFLRRGMKWSDGHPYTVDDVLFWYEDLILHKELTPIPPSWLLHGGELPTVEKIDPYTIRFTFQAPYLNLPLILGSAAERNFMACPKHYLKTFHPTYVDPEELKKRAREEGFTTWRQYFEAKRDMFYQSNPDLPTLGPWKLRDGIPSNPAVYVDTAQIN